ncbi:hypothetical protein NSP_40100 [Nodularia spumigena CCY9414]|nr:hypothetical protein NSP_40100 [Nodularia spumigena CCY9414]
MCCRVAQRTIPDSQCFRTNIYNAAYSPLPTPHSPFPIPHSPLPTPYSPLPNSTIDY